jgi:uncharacterized protein
LKFNGTNNEVDTPGNASLRPSNFTISLWLNPAAACTSAAFKVAGGDGFVSGFRIDCDYDSVKEVGMTWGDGVAFNGHVNAPTALPVGAWTHVVGTYDGTTMSLYVNGLKVGSNSTVTFGYTLSDGPSQRIGIAPGSGFWDGRIDDVRLYNRALSAAEVMQLYQGGTATHQNTTLNPPNVNGGGKPGHMAAG